MCSHSKTVHMVQNMNYECMLFQAAAEGALLFNSSTVTTVSNTKINK